MRAMRWLELRLGDNGRSRVSTFEAMALPPRSFGSRASPVRLEKIGERGQSGSIDERPLEPTFVSEREARGAAAAEAARRDATGLALLRRIRSSLNRKRR